MKKNTLTEFHPASFRDPSGFIFQRNGRLYRQVNRSYADDFDALNDTGLYAELVDTGVLLAHEGTQGKAPLPAIAYKVLELTPLDFISYPYEWCFSQWKDAALVTLRAQRTALEHGMSLKDASAFNVQFQGTSPILIDSLSFERFKDGEPWIAYRQFCRHFLAPLALMSYVDIELGKLMRSHIDGVPLSLASRLMPRRTRFRLSLLVHIHWHASAERRYAGTVTPGPSLRRRMGKSAHFGLVDNLEGAINRLSWSGSSTAWADYEATHEYSRENWEAKRQIVEDYLDGVRPETVWDLGANVGTFSRLASDRGIPTVAFDFDPGAVELAYHRAKSDELENFLPLVMDLINPSPALGWEHRERHSLEERGPAASVLALALVHHLAISNNLPLRRVAEFLSRLCRSLLVEFVPKGDPQIQRLLSSREDIFAEYHEEGFRESFGSFFEIEGRFPIADSGRTLFQMKSRV